ncbi:MAG: hypothetical protein FJ039_06350 [Chloroflexi bacterium]|nr:hypothetical protein [Chloroflexota bacterium]
MSQSRQAGKRIEAGDAWEAIERFFDEGLTDGLPIVPPTEALVARFLEAVHLPPDQIVGRIPERSIVLTAEKVAANAVMAGCRPEYMPVVLAIVEAICEPKFNLHGSSASTGGSAQLVIVNGPIAGRLGINSGVNLFGPGARANATIGRAVRLVVMNVVGSIPGVLDKSTMGHPGKYSYCIAEAEDVSPWAPLHVERGLTREESAVTVVAAEGPHQVYDHSNNRPEGILGSVAEAMAVCNRGYGTFVVVLCPEHAGYIAKAGWSKQQVKQFLYDQAQRPVAFYKRTGKTPGTVAPEDEAKLTHVLTSPGAAMVVVGGGMAGGFSAVIPTWGRGAMSAAQTKAVKG